MSKFTEEGFRAWLETPGNSKGYDFYKTAAEYAATLEAPMTEAEVLAYLQSQGLRPPYSHGEMKVLTLMLPLTLQQPRPSDVKVERECPDCGTNIRDNGFGYHHSASCQYLNRNFNDNPVGGLTKEWITTLGFNNAELTWSEATDAIWSRIEGERAKWNNRWMDDAKIIDDLRAQLADLRANSIPMPKWEDAPEWATGVVLYFCIGHEASEDYNSSGRHLKHHVYIPRPIPEAREKSDPEYRDELTERMHYAPRLVLEQIDILLGKGE